MKSAMPKVLHRIAGAPLVGHVLATARALDAAHVVVVVRHERDRVAEAVRSESPGAVDRRPGRDPRHRPCGGGRAGGAARGLRRASARAERRRAAPRRRDARAIPRAPPRGGAAATVPQRRLRRPVRLRPCRARRGGRPSSASSSRRTPPTTSAAIAEINAGVYVFQARARCATALDLIGTENAQGEKYLTDVVGLLRVGRSEVEAVPVSEPWLVAGINDRAQLSEAAALLNARIVRGWQSNGVTIHDPATTWIDLAARIAPDVTIRPGTQLMGATVIARAPSSGPTRPSSTARSARTPR